LGGNAPQSMRRGVPIRSLRRNAGVHKSGVV